VSDPRTAIAAALDQVGPRLKQLRTQRGVNLTALAESTGISKSTLSRLETGQRRASLELLCWVHTRAKSVRCAAEH
jgi:transcriptional regulator with XRE-family HTH domain